MVSNRHHTKIAKLLIRAVKILVPVLVILFTYDALMKRTSGNLFSGFSFSIDEESLTIMILVFVLSFFNIFSEAWKWKEMTSEFNYQSWGEAIKSVMVGMSLGFITPGRVGDFYGRAISTGDDNKTGMISIAVLAGIIQATITIVAGLVAFLFFRYIGSNVIGNSLILHLISIGLFSVVIINVVLLYNPAVVLGLLSKISLLKYFVNIPREFVVLYSSSRVIKFFCIGILRYMIFLLQFLLLLKVFGVTGNSFYLSMQIAVVFLMTSFIPSFVLGKLGIREAVAVFVIGIPLNQVPEVLSASLLLWIINQVIPSVTGCVFLFQFRKMKESV